MYIDVPETGNIDLKLDDEKKIVVVNSQATITDVGALIFTIDAVLGYKIALADIEAAGFVAKDQIIIRGSVSVADATKNNDGVYTVKAVGGTAGTGYITVNEPIVAYADCAATATVDEFDTFILHPTKPTMQICIYVEAGATPATFEVSFEPGGYWAAKIEKGLPVMQGNGTATFKYLIQIETAPYLQTEEEVLIAYEEDVCPEANRKGSLLMRVFPPAGVTMTALIGVALVQLA